MKIKADLSSLISLCAVLALSLLLVLKPELGRDGCIRGLLLCGRVLIPSLFAFTVCVLYIAKCGILNRLKFLNRAAKRLFGLNSAGLSVMLLSFIGGYPVGARLLNSYCENGQCDSEKAGVMLNCCINAGPAFVISAVGSGILSSKRVGIMLFACHIIASLIICFILRFIYGEFDIKGTSEEKRIAPADNFVLSVSQAAETTLSICFFVILFSVINAYMSHYTELFPPLGALGGILEVTNGVAGTKSIYVIAFLLGFSGICVWCQIIAVSGNIKIRLYRLALFRLLHGIFSAILMHLALRLCGTALPAISAGGFKGKILYSDASLGAAMLIMGIIFIISLTTKKYAGKILEDVV